MAKHTIFVAASATAVLSALLLMPPFAPAASAQPECQAWDIPVPNRVEQSNGWTAYLDSATAARSWNTGGGKQMSGIVAFQPMNLSDVKFTITWDNGSGGIYTGQIDPNGFVSGRTADKWHPESTADWHMWDAAPCRRWA